MYIQTSSAVIAAWMLVAPGWAAAQRGDVPKPAAAAQTKAASVPMLESLHIFVLEGQGAINNLRKRTASTPVVEVRDENGQPLEGAEIEFQLPAVGPGGSFAGQQQTLKVKTNVQGQAEAPFTPNLETGRFNIKVTATIGNRTGSAVITQTNSLKATEQKQSARKFRLRSWKTAAIAGGGAAVLGAVLATRGGSTPATVIPTITLTPGAPSFGAPH